MTRCPNCGSAIRIGAKFCTSCGFRLPGDESVVAQSRSPFATTSSAPWSAAPVRVAEDIVVEDVPAPNGNPDPEPAWSKDDGDDDAVVEVPPAEDAVVAVSPSGDAEVIEMVPTEPEGNDQPGRSWFMPPTPDRSGPISDDMIATMDSDAAGSEAQRQVEPPDPGDDGRQAEAQPAGDGEVMLGSSVGSSNSSPPVSPSDPTDAPEVNGMTSPPSLSTGTDVAPPVGQGDPLAEARSLVARLTDVLAQVPGGGGGAPADEVSLSGIADPADVESLRTIVESARERPRDVDVMLDLVLRADTIAAVIADRDMLLAALRGDEQAVEDAWSPDDDQPSTYPAWGA